MTKHLLSLHIALACCLLHALALRGETVDQLPKPTGYVSDFAGVLAPGVEQQVESLCTAVDRQAHAQIAVVTIKTLENDQSIEEFATQLEEKWGVGAKGTERGVLMLLVMTPRRGRIEVGYGLEGILNDAKVGDIGRSMVPDAQAGNYNAAVPLGVQQIANVIAEDAGVTIQPIVRGSGGQRHSQSAPYTMGPMLVFGLIFLFIVLSAMGRGGRGGGGGGLGWFILGNLLGGMGGRGRGGYGGGDFGGGFGGGGGGDGGGFGGFGGGSSGGGGASGDF